MVYLTTTNIVYALLALLVLIVTIWMWRMEVRMKRLLTGKNAKSLEDTFASFRQEIHMFKQFTKEMEEYLTTVEYRLKKSIQSVETTRFNPFKGTGDGGNQSFSCAFVNEKGDGVVLTSMYARDRISMFAKPLKNFVSEFELSEEEQQSVERSKQQLSA
ncbi:DUF4446 family protein [Candidatus Parcubacteria bacterium]|nr:DUF4446 family protein [Candidatus Parcubacteria bacterium]